MSDPAAATGGSRRLEASSAERPRVDDPFRFVDGIGPRKILLVAEPRVGLRAIVVVDSVARGPAIGGVRIAAAGTVEECVRLARAMTLKNAAAGIPHGGGKSVIVADPHAAAGELERLLRAFACGIRDLTEYIPGPDMGTTETSMAWIFDEIGRAVGLPRALGGIPLDEIGATGLGVAVATEVACARSGIPLAGARIAVQGFGAVGRHAARMLVARGARIVAAEDRRGGIHDPAGIDPDLLAAHKRAGEPASTYRPGAPLAPGEIIGVDCDVWIPAAQPDVLHAADAGRLRARIVVEGANIPATPAAETALHARGVLVVPDVVANAGGVISASVEYHGGSEAAALAAVEERIRANTSAVLSAAASEGRTPRDVAMGLALERVHSAMSVRRHA